MPSPFPQMFGAPQPDFVIDYVEEGVLRVTRTSLFTRKRNQMLIPTTLEAFGRWQSGALVQDAFPELTPDQREFIMSGATPEEWANIFPPDPEEED